MKMAAQKKPERWIADAIEYWSMRVDESDIGVDWCDAGERCWRCGGRGKRQRCHIVPAQFGGSDTVDNLIPLCAGCHDEMPDVTDRDAVWVWISRTRPQYGYGLLRHERALKACMSRGIDISLFSREKARELMSHAGLHLFQNRSGAAIKQSSLEWVIENSCTGQTNG